MNNKAFDKSKYPNWIAPDCTTPYVRNAKIHTEKQIENIANSIRRFGWQQDVVITSDGVLVIGHGRRLAAMKLGCDMPYHTIDKKADELTDDDIRELRIADNQTNAETGVDWETLEAELADLSFDGFDFDFGASEDDYGEDFTLPSGDHGAFETMTFTFSRMQAEAVRNAISDMRQTSKYKNYDDPDNENGNANALYLVVSEWQALKT